MKKVVQEYEKQWPNLPLKYRDDSVCKFRALFSKNIFGLIIYFGVYILMSF